MIYDTSHNDCIRRAEAAMASGNIKLVEAHSLSGRRLVILATEKIDPAGQDPGPIFASHCPFCGKKYDIGSTFTRSEG